MNAQADLEEFCPCCGKWVTALDDVTGWCPHCCGSTPGGMPCRKCGRAKPHDHYSSRYWRGVCRACRTEQKNAWRTANPERDRANNVASYARRMGRLA